MCVHCRFADEYVLPSGIGLCSTCFDELYCRVCWNHINVVGMRTNYNGMMLCITCINNTPPEDDESQVDNDESLPPANFDMNDASSIEDSPDYIDTLINAQVEYEGNWYFAQDGQIYSVPYEIQIDDTLRQDILDNWDGVQWRGAIFGNYIAWY